MKKYDRWEEERRGEERRKKEKKKREGRGRKRDKVREREGWKVEERNIVCFFFVFGAPEFRVVVFGEEMTKTPCCNG